MYDYIKNFETLGFGLFVHFGLYSVAGKGEWYLHNTLKHDARMTEKYEKLPEKFNVNKTWAKNLVKTAKAAGCKYITLTTRHHDGFSLYNTKGLSDYDAPHSAAGRDLIKEFTEECRKENILPVFYHTLLDWHQKSYNDNFPEYIDYLIKSVEILCTSYGKIGGFWFDGKWDKPNADWQEDRLYETIRKYQPEAMIINNTGLNELGKVGHFEIDSVTFERGKPAFVDKSDKYRTGEMCQILNDHWGYASNDCNYKSVKELLENLVDCRKYNCNFLLNTGLRGNGAVNPTDKNLLKEIGKWVKKNDEFVRFARSSDVSAVNADILRGRGCYYAVIKNVPMESDPNVTILSEAKKITPNLNIKKAIWLDNGKKIKIEKNGFTLVPFEYGSSYSVRIAKIFAK